LSPSAVTETVEVSAKFHGGASEYVRNSDFDARLFFKPSVGHVAYNQVNGFIGGPIKKNKLFFFGLYQRTMDHEANTNTDTIPTPVQKTGDLSTASNGGFTMDTVYDPATGAISQQHNSHQPHQPGFGGDPQYNTRPDPADHRRHSHQRLLRVAALHQDDGSLGFQGRLAG
jgi:hypothetical protein